MVRDLLNPVTGTADIDEEIFRFRDFDSNDEASAKEIIKKLLLPTFETASMQYKVASKLSLAYFLSNENFDFGDLYDSCLIAFDHPANPRNFFLWIWQIFFPTEEYQNVSNKDYTEIDDAQEPYKYWTEK
jgi:hypothetical protein